MNGFFALNFVPLYARYASICRQLFIESRSRKCRQRRVELRVFIVLTALESCSDLR
jgi:hypothetical protein